MTKSSSCLPPPRRRLSRGAGAAEAIGIIDGYFERVPSVWHKEILWAMAEGIHVFGSASMGALRAAELLPSAWMASAASSRRSCRRARGRRRGRRDPRAGRDRLPRSVRGHGQHPPHSGAGRANGASSSATTPASAGSRRQGAALPRPDLRAAARARRRPLDAPAVLAALRAWPPQGRVDQKREDALAMLAAMQMPLASDPEPLRVDYALEWTAHVGRCSRHLCWLTDARQQRGGMAGR